MNLDLAGVGCTTDSACSSGSLLPSPVILTKGVHADVLHPAMRYNFSPTLSKAQSHEAERRVARVGHHAGQAGQALLPALGAFLHRVDGPQELTPLFPLAVQHVVPGLGRKPFQQPVEDLLGAVAPEVGGQPGVAPAGGAITAD